MKRIALASACLMVAFVAACSAGKTDSFGDGSFAIPPTEEMVRAEPKGLNLEDQLARPYDVGAAAAQTISASVESAPSNLKPDVDTRLANLEAAVASLRADYDTIVPTFKTLSVNTDRLVSLMDRLEGRTADQIAPAAGAPVLGSADSSAPALTSAALSAPSAVTKVRIGDNTGVTRIVLDVEALSQYTYEVDNAGRQMLIAMPFAQWKAGQQAFSIASPLVESWRYEALAGGGAGLILTLKKDVKIVGRNSLPANGDKGPRIYVDIAPLS